MGKVGGGQEHGADEDRSITAHHAMTLPSPSLMRQTSHHEAKRCTDIVSPT